jgi:hypothetical protein
MKKLYSFVLMATMLLIGTNVWADDEPVYVAQIGAQKYTSLETAWAAVKDGETIVLLDDCTPAKTLWLGTETMKDKDNVKSITLNMAGHNIAFNFKKSKPAFFITHGSLNITGTGTISLGSVGEGGYSLVAGTVGGVTTSNASHWVMFQVTGSTYQEVDPSDDTKTPYTHLTIGKDVTVDCQGIGIVVDDLNGATSAQHKWPLSSTATDDYAAVATYNVSIPAVSSTNKAMSTKMYKKDAGGSDGARGLAYGVRVDVKGHIIAGKYGIKANTELAGPSNPINDNGLSNFYKASTETNDDKYTSETAACVKDYTPFIKIWDDATITEVNTTEGGIGAVYGGGYARWQIEGDCKGSTGAFIKSGEVVVAGDATIESNYANPYTAGSDAGLDRGFEGGGSGLVINSSDLAVGDVKVTIKDEATVKGAGGYAIEEGISTANGHSEVESIKIEGGSIEQGANGQGIITVTTETRGDNTSTTVAISGGTFEGDEDGVTLGAQTLDQFLQTQRESGQDTHGVIVYVDPVTSEQTVVISPGPAPIVANSVIAAAANTSINWINATTKAETLTADKKLDELQISQDYDQVLTINPGVTLEVGRVVLGAKAQIIVKPGAKLIVSGEQGLAAFKESNLVLENGIVNDEVKRSIFLFHPNVTSNIHPKATFELTTTSWRDATKNPIAQSEVFGIPTYDAITSIACKEVGKYAYIQGYKNGGWENIAFTDDANFPKEKLNQPFAAYAVTAYRTEAEDPLTIQIGGELVGNTDATLAANWKWNFFANSYTAEVDLAEFLEGLDVTAHNVDKSIYLSGVNGNGYWTWEAIDAATLGEEGIPAKLQPLQGFLLNNIGNQAEENAINYESMVYAPAVPGYTPAPRRNVAANEYSAKMFVVLTSDNGSKDNVKLRETANTKSVEKYMNDDVNIYAMNEEKSAIFAAEDLANTYLGFSTLAGGNFTISFTNVQGREFDLVDLQTGARVAASEGETYTFTAAANTVADYRFQLVDRQNAPTAIDNTEAVKSLKGIYTITGQYVGEMNVWNTLPAGVYVIDGAKRVK